MNQENWLTLTDEKLTAAALAEQVENRLKGRRSDLGVDTRRFPSFGFVSSLPQPGDEQFAPNLYYHLHRFNEQPPAEMAPVLTVSPAMRIPLLGRLWRVFRQEAHHLVLFYVGRLAAENRHAHNHLINILNELTRLTEEQQGEIDQLRREIAQLQQEGPDGG